MAFHSPGQDDGLCSGRTVYPIIHNITSPAAPKNEKGVNWTRAADSKRARTFRRAARTDRSEDANGVLAGRNLQDVLFIAE
jgi:hypothetical protein